MVRTTKQINRRDPGGVIAQESLPTFGRWSAAPDHIHADGRFCDVDPKHQQFAVDPRCAPQWVLAIHASDQRSYLGTDPWTAAHAAGLPVPVGAETAPVPTDHRLRLDDDNRVQQRRVQFTATPKAGDRCSTVSRASGICAVELPAVGAGRYSRLLNVNYFCGRIDSRFLLPERSRLPHVNCYPAAELRGGGGDGEASEHRDTARTQAGGWRTLSGGGSVGTPPDPRRLHSGDRLSPQACAASIASAVRATADAAAQADLRRSGAPGPGAVVGGGR